jgi:hypothetical protein
MKFGKQNAKKFEQSVLDYVSTGVFTNEEHAAVQALIDGKIPENIRQHDKQYKGLSTDRIQDMLIRMKRIHEQRDRITFHDGGVGYYRAFRKFEDSVKMCVNKFWGDMDVLVVPIPDFSARNPHTWQTILQQDNRSVVVDKGNNKKLLIMFCGVPELSKHGVMDPSILDTAKGLTVNMMFPPLEKQMTTADIFRNSCYWRISYEYQLFRRNNIDHKVGTISEWAFRKCANWHRKTFMNVIAKRRDYTSWERFISGILRTPWFISFRD